MAGSFLARTRRRVSERGWRDTARKFVGDHLFRATDSVVLECRPEWLSVAPVRAPVGVSFHVVRRGDALPRLCRWLAPRRDDFAAMLDAGKIGLFALRDGAAVACAWLSLDDHVDPHAREHYRVAPGEAYQYCALTEPAERRRGTTFAFARFTLATVREMGIRRQFAVVDRRNRASYLGLRRFGYRECGMLVRHFYVLHMRWTRVSSYRGVLDLAAPALRRPA